MSIYVARYTRDIVCVYGYKCVYAIQIYHVAAVSRLYLFLSERFHAGKCGKNEKRLTNCELPKLRQCENEE